MTLERVINQRHKILAFFTRSVQSCGIIPGMLHDHCDHEKIRFNTPFQIIATQCVHVTVLTDLYRPPHSVLDLNTIQYQGNWTLKRYLEQ